MKTGRNLITTLNAVKVTTRTVFAFLLFATLFSCNYRENKSGLHWFLDMHDTYARESQEEDSTNKHASVWTTGADNIKSLGGSGTSMRVPPEGSVPRGYRPYLIGSAAEAGRVLRNPLKADRSILKRGQMQYSIYCALCHGNTGKGDGSVVPRYPMAVANLTAPRSNAASWADGRIFHIITKGTGGAMKSYAAQIKPIDRWAIIHYLRLMQHSEAKRTETKRK